MEQSNDTPRPSSPENQISDVYEPPEVHDLGTVENLTWQASEFYLST